MATLKSVCTEIRTQSEALQHQLDLYEGGVYTIDVDETQRSAADSLARKFSTIANSGDCQTQLIAAIREHHAPYGAAVQIMIDEANSLAQNSSDRRPAKHARTTQSGKVFEVEQHIDSLHYFTDGDWKFCCDKTKLVPMKIAKLAQRLRQWGVKHLAQKNGFHGWPTSATSTTIQCK